MKDDEFLLDRIAYEEVYEDKYNTDDLNSLEALLEKDNEKQYVQKNVNYLQFVYSPLRAFSICWPYVTLSGL